MPLVINRDAIIDAIVESKVGASAKEAAGPYVEAWIDTYAEADSTLTVHAVEVPFYIQIEKKTFVVGQQDAIFSDEQGWLCGEWKTKRAPRNRRDGTPYVGESEDDWLEEISQGPQLKTYALAAKHGRFFIGNLNPRPQLASEHPRIMVRAVLKSNPADFWPADPARGIFAFSDLALRSCHDAYVAKATAIRAMRKLGKTPWQLIGPQCKAYGRMCEHYDNCKAHRYPDTTPRAWFHPDDAAPDPGYEVCKLLKLDPSDPELVVLSQSAYQAFSRCAELGRTAYGGYFAREASFELQVGTATHAGLAAFYQQIRDARKKAA